MATIRQLMEYAVESFKVKLAAGELPTFGEVLVEALFIYDEISVDVAERYSGAAGDAVGETTGDSAVNVADSGSGGILESETP